jgi:hypothetical protein
MKICEMQKISKNQEYSIYRLRFRNCPSIANQKFRDILIRRGLGILPGICGTV